MTAMAWPTSSKRCSARTPFVTDTDGDTVSDLLDDCPLDPTRTQRPALDPNDTTPPVITLTRPASARPVGGGGGNQ
jgi:hypothetical protein